MSLLTDNYRRGKSAVWSNIGVLWTNMGEQKSPVWANMGGNFGQSAARVPPVAPLLPASHYQRMLSSSPSPLGGPLL